MLTFLTIRKKILVTIVTVTEQKIQKTTRRNSRSCTADNEDVLAEGFNDSSCRDILCNCFKELEAKVVKIYEVANNTIIKSQLKSEKQLEDLKSSFD